MVAAVRLWVGIAPVPQASARECRYGVLADPLGSHWLGGCPRSVPLRTFRHTEVLQRVATVLRADPRWTGVVAEPPLPTGEQSTALRPDLRATRVSSGAPLWGDVSVVAATAAINVSRTAGSPRVPRAARVREAEKFGKYTPVFPLATRATPSHRWCGRRAGGLARPRRLSSPRRCGRRTTGRPCLGCWPMCR